MLQVTYASAAARPFMRMELEQLLARSREKNAKRGITGLLLYDKGSFLQVIEGAEDAVEALLDRIRDDDRHGKLIVLRRRTIAARQFGEWQMGFVDLAAHRDLPGFSHFLEDGRIDQGQLEPVLLEFLSQFRSGRWRQSVG